MTTEYEELTEWWRARNKKGYQWKIAKRDFLHDFSRHLVLIAKPILGNVQSIHEIGCGMGRNLHYFLKAYKDRGLPAPVFSGNDLDRNACFKHMKSELKRVITLHELDTLSFLRREVNAGRTIDLLVSSDHMIHLSPESIQDVHSLLSQYAKKYILFKEATRSIQPSRSEQAHYWFVHEYDFKGFEIIETDRENRTDPKGEYEITLLERLDKEVVHQTAGTGILDSISMQDDEEVRWIEAYANSSSSERILTIGHGIERVKFSGNVSHLSRSANERGCAGRMEAMPFENEMFNLILVGDVLYDAFDPELVCSEVRRVLRLNGTVLMALENSAFHRRGLFSRLRGVDIGLPKGATGEMFPIEQLKKMLRNVRLSVCEQQRFGPQRWGQARRLLIVAKPE